MNRHSREGIEKVEDVQDRIANIRKRFVNSPNMGWQPFLEGYIKGEQGLHVHLCQNEPLDLGGRFVPSYLCATFGWPTGVFLDDVEREFWDARAREERVHNVTESETVEGREQMTELVDVPEFIQDRERLFGRILPVAKRLQPLEVCAQTWPDSPEAIRLRGLAPNVPDNHALLLNERLYHALLLNRRLQDGFEVDDYLAGIRAKLSFKAVRIVLRKRIDPFVQQFNFHFRPIQPRKVDGSCAQR